METIELNLYSIEELDRQAFEKALKDFKDQKDYPYSPENKHALRVFEESIRGLTITDFSYGYRKNLNYEIDSNFTIKDFDTMVKNNFPELWENIQEYKNGNAESVYVSYELTGYYVDAHLLEPIAKYYENGEEREDYELIIRDCLQNWLNHCHNDVHEYFTSDNFIEVAKINDWKFLADGTRWKKRWLEESNL